MFINKMTGYPNKHRPFSLLTAFQNESFVFNELTSLLVKFCILRVRTPSDSCQKFNCCARVQ